MKQFLTDLFSSQSYDEKNFFLIAGPCVVESEDLIMEVADKFRAFVKDWYSLCVSNRATGKQTEQALTLSQVLVMRPHCNW
jgi:3-deoxy-D-arabino-heptulosonate 7-phosphate (DAHP) synthase